LQRLDIEYRGRLGILQGLGFGVAVDVQALQCRAVSVKAAAIFGLNHYGYSKSHVRPIHL
jgi:hypothetical protein